MKQQELYAKAKELGAMIAIQLDKTGGTQQEGMTIFGYAAALILYSYALQNGKDIQKESAYFGRYIQDACATFVDTETIKN